MRFSKNPAKGVSVALLILSAIFSFSVLTVLVPNALAKTIKMSVQIVNRQSETSQYVYTVPGYGTSNCNAYAYGNAASSNCSATGMPATSARFQVEGATLSLLLPDSRIVVVNCDAKANWTDWHQGMYRSCRVPLINTVEAKFHGDKAKLTWSVSLDGSKKESETYKIIEILSKAPTPTGDSKR